MTPIFYAVESQNYSISKLLLEYGANPEHEDRHKSTAFYWGVYCSTIEILRLL